jgi:hypothetical protein
MAREPSETVYQFLERRERELQNLATAIRGDLNAVEHELAHVQSAKRQIGNLPPPDKAKFNALSSVVTPPSADDLAAKYGQLGQQLSNAVLGTQNALAALVAPDEPTIKKLVLRALWIAFPEKGATAADLRRFIIDAYGRNIHPSSMSPQLSRLKAEGLIKQKEGEIWRFTVMGAKQMMSEIGPPPPTE